MTAKVAPPKPPARSKPKADRPRLSRKQLAGMAKSLQHWSLKKLRPYDKNPRIHTAEDVKELSASILEFGFIAPIVVDEKAGILDGHERLAAARELGLSSVPVIEVTWLTRAQKRGYMISANKLATRARWDPKGLDAMLADLRKQGMELSLVGFGEQDLRRLADDVLKSSIDTLRANSRAAEHIRQGARRDGSSSAPAAAEEDEPQETVLMHVTLTPEQRGLVYTVLRQVKKTRKLESMGQALFTLCKEWRSK